MKAVIIGCGRVGAGLADELDRAGWQVLIIDRTSAAFDRLPATFRGTALRGDGTDEDTLRRAGAEGAELFLALTEGDNRNIMAAQLGIEALGARWTMAKCNDPVRAEAYAHLGIATVCRTNLMTTAILEHLGQAVPTAAGIYAPSRHHEHSSSAAAAAGGAAVPAGGAAAPAGGAAVRPGGAAGGTTAKEA
jgi:trk system potassium uptake protein TrkA